MNKRQLLAVLVLACMGILVACGSKKVGHVKESEYYLYYIDKEETKVVRENYQPVATDTEELIAEFVEALNKDPRNYTYRKAKPDTVVLKDYTYNGSGQLILNFETSYYELEGIAEVLTRAAIVKNFCQIEEIEYDDCGKFHR